MLRAPWSTSLGSYGALGVPTATLRCVNCDARTTCLPGDLTALVLSMFKTWRWTRRPWRPYCDLQRCHGALWDLTTTQRRSGRFYRSWRGRRPVWLGYNDECTNRWISIVIAALDVNSSKYIRWSWRRHDLELFSALLAPWEWNPPVIGGFLWQRVVMQSVRFLCC